MSFAKHAAMLQAVSEHHNDYFTEFSRLHIDGLVLKHLAYQFDRRANKLKRQTCGR